MRSLLSLGLILLLLTSQKLAVANREPQPYSTPTQKREYLQRYAKVTQLWRLRKRRDVTLPLLTMLRQERTPQLRTNIVITLGRLESPQALKPLQELLAQVRRARPVAGGPLASRANWRSQIDEYRIQLALGRIRSKPLRGRRKLNVVAQSVGTDWTGIQRKAARLRTQMQGGMSVYNALDSDDLQIVEEFYDVLYRMGKRGENIQALGASGLKVYNSGLRVSDALRSQDQALLQAASLSDAAEVRFWLQRSMPPSAAGFSPDHLLDLGPTVPAELMKYLRLCLARAKANPGIMQPARGHTSLFDAAAASSNRKFIPILKEFEKVNDRWTKIYAQQAIERF